MIPRSARIVNVDYRNRRVSGADLSFTLYPFLLAHTTCLKVRTLWTTGRYIPASRLAMWSNRPPSAVCVLPSIGWAWVRGLRRWTRQVVRPNLAADAAGGVDCPAFSARNIGCGILSLVSGLNVLTGFTNRLFCGIIRREFPKLLILAAV